MTGEAWRLPSLNWRNLAAIFIVFSLILLLGLAAKQMVEPSAPAEQTPIPMSPFALPDCALRTTAGMLVGLAASVVFTFTDAAPR